MGGSVTMVLGGGFGGASCRVDQHAGCCHLPTGWC